MKSGYEIRIRKDKSQDKEVWISREKFFGYVEGPVKDMSGY